MAPGTLCPDRVLGASHAQTCKRGPDVIAHHNGLRNIVLRFFKQAAAALNPQREAGRVQCGIYSVQHVGMGPSERKCKEHARLKLQGLDHQWNTLPPVPLNQDI